MDIHTVERRNFIITTNKLAYEVLPLGIMFRCLCNITIELSDMKVNSTRAARVLLSESNDLNLGEGKRATTHTQKKNVLHRFYINRASFLFCFLTTEHFIRKFL
jgi:hypothetical protein